MKDKTQISGIILKEVLFTTFKVYLPDNIEQNYIRKCSTDEYGETITYHHDLDKTVVKDKNIIKTLDSIYKQLIQMDIG